MLGENKDSYIHSYIQTQSRGIACETLLTLHLLERGENEGQRNRLGRKLWQRRAVNQPPWPGPPKCDVTLR